MKLYTRQRELRTVIDELKKQGKTIGFVPTMGALHQGHLSLMRKAMQENDAVVVSIFVNPTQFNNSEDLKKYPRTLDRDMERIRTLSRSFMVYAPSVEDIYQERVVAESFSFDGLDAVMEGVSRPGHFDGVGTVVRKLFDIVAPDTAYFGEKDYQQLLIIKKMVDQCGLAVNIVPCPIVREETGLAMSSRNERLSDAARQAAAFIYQTLMSAKKMKDSFTVEEICAFVKGAFSGDDRFELEYFIIADSETLQQVKFWRKDQPCRAFIAVWIEGVRLIDNIAF